MMKFEKVPKAKLPTRFGEFTIYGFKDPDSGEEAVALVSGIPRPGLIPLVRIHSQCLTGDVFSSDRCDCGEQLHTAMRMVSKFGLGVIIYQQREGRGIGLINKLHAYELQDQGLDTVAANQELGFMPDERDYRLPAEILKHFGIGEIQLLTNNPDKALGLEQEGIRVAQLIPLEVSPSPSTREYLRVKKQKLGHRLSKVDE